MCGCQTGGTGPADQGDIFSTLTRWTRAGDDTPKNDEHYAIAKMDEGEVDIGLITAWCGPRGFSITNEDVARCVDTYPERFRGLASVNLYRPMEAVRDLRRWVKNHGFVGLRIVPWLCLQMIDATIHSLPNALNLGYRFVLR